MRFQRHSSSFRNEVIASSRTRNASYCDYVARTAMTDVRPNGGQTAFSSVVIITTSSST
jgi:hypothetical protein